MVLIIESIAVANAELLVLVVEVLLLQCSDLIAVVRDVAANRSRETVISTHLSFIKLVWSGRLAADFFTGNTSHCLPSRTAV